MDKNIPDQRLVRRALLSLLFLAGYVLTGTAYANQETKVQDLHVCAPDGVALDGYDVVSYHLAEKPVLGLTTLTATHKDLTYQFSTEANQKLFLEDSDRYLPTYLGWCSTNLAMGRLACPDYQNFKIEEGRLLLFEHAGFTNGRDIWNTDPAAHKQLADGNFKRFSAQ